MTFLAFRGSYVYIYIIFTSREYVYYAWCLCCHLLTVVICWGRVCFLWRWTTSHHLDRDPKWWRFGKPLRAGRRNRAWDLHWHIHLPNPLESQLELLSYYLSDNPDWIVGVGYGLHHLRKCAQHFFEIFGIWAWEERHTHTGLPIWLGFWGLSKKGCEDIVHSKPFWLPRAWFGSHFLSGIWRWRFCFLFIIISLLIKINVD